MQIVGSNPFAHRVFLTSFCLAFATLVVFPAFSAGDYLKFAGTQLMLGKSLAMEGRLAEAEAHLREAASSSDARVREMAVFWLDRINAPRLPDAALSSRVRQGTRRGTEAVGEEAERVEVDLARNPLSAEAHLRLAEANLWNSQLFFHRPATVLMPSISVYSSGAPYAALREAGLAFQLANTAEQQIRALELKRQAWLALYWDVTLDYYRRGCDIGNGPGCAAYSDLMEMRMERANQITEKMARLAEKILEKNPGAEIHPDFYYPMEPLLRNDSFFILAPVE
jgi:hypothetical protein